MCCSKKAFHGVAGLAARRTAKLQRGGAWLTASTTHDVSLTRPSRAHCARVQAKSFSGHIVEAWLDKGRGGSESQEAGNSSKLGTCCGYKQSTLREWWRTITTRYDGTHSWLCGLWTTISWTGSTDSVEYQEFEAFQVLSDHDSKSVSAHWTYA